MKSHKQYIEAVGPEAHPRYLIADRDLGTWDGGDWLLLGRREKYVLGSGKHELYLTAGGVRRDRVFSLVIDEGTEASPDWYVAVLTEAEKIAADKKAKDEAATAKNPTVKMVEMWILDTINEHDKGCNISTILKVVKGRRDALLKNLAKLEAEGRIEKVKIKNKNGTTSAGYKGVVIAENTTCEAS